MKARSASGAVHPDIVPSDVLALEAARGLRAGDCALVLDGYLRRLVRQEARARRILGTLARAFLRRRHHHDLGFARLRDYTRERLGLSARDERAHGAKAGDEQPEGRLLGVASATQHLAPARADVARAREPHPHALLAIDGVAGDAPAGPPGHLGLGGGCRHVTSIPTMTHAASAETAAPAGSDRGS